MFFNPSNSDINGMLSIHSTSDNTCFILFSNYIKSMYLKINALVNNLFFCFFGWLVDYMVGWMVGWVLGRLVGSMVAWFLAALSSSRSLVVCPSVGRSVNNLCE